MQAIQLLAILGRGIQQPATGGKWTLTEDLEICDEKGVHLAVRVPADDEYENCLIGGGELNLLAGVTLCALHQKTLRAAVCAYGARSPYLSSINAPSESEVMSRKLKTFLAFLGASEYLEIVVWSRERLTEGPSNTSREIQNIFELAVERGFTEVGMATIAVHYPRSLLMAERHRMQGTFSHLKLQCFVSEDIILRYLPEYFGTRIRALHGSRAFMRTLFREQRGINCLFAGNY